jgi:hypothetical protein
VQIPEGLDLDSRIHEEEEDQPDEEEEQVPSFALSDVFKASLTSCNVGATC